MYKNFVSFISIFPVCFFKKLAGDPINNIIHSGSNLFNFSTQSYTIITLLSLIPTCLLMMSCFTRIIIIFIGFRKKLEDFNSSFIQVLIGLSFFLTFCIISPVFKKMYNTGCLPLYKHEINEEVALHNCLQPLSQFMLKQTRKSDILAFCHLFDISYSMNKENIPMKALLPAFMISELKTMLQMGFTVLLPFLIIDWFVASVLMFLGVKMISPSSIALPLKLLIFTLFGRWQLLILSLSKSF